MTPPIDHAVELRAVDKSFDGRPLFRGLDLAVRRGETMAVLGPSGIGKSVLLRLIVGLHKPDRGQVLVDGEDVAPLDESALRDVRRRVGMLFQGGALFDSMSVAENIAYGLREHEEWRAERLDRRVAECLEWVGLEGNEQARPGDLSGGMKKRVGLARAIAPGPRIILYDEPTTGLDPANKRRINELIVGMRKRLAVTSLVITHDMPSALDVADRIALIAGQRIALVVGAEEARAAPPPALARFMEGDFSTEDAR